MDHIFGEGPEAKSPHSDGQWRELGAPDGVLAETSRCMDIATFYEIESPYRIYTEGKCRLL